MIRFLGYKGVVSVDEELDNLPNGVMMRSRDSMKKFDVLPEPVGEIEIAEVYTNPRACYLDRRVPFR